MPKVSVIIPFYNSIEYVPQAIDSLKKQTCGFDNIQVILVDDGSNNNCAGRARAAFGKFKNIEIAGISHGGPAVARNAGLSRAKGDLICFLDSDDMLESNLLKRALECSQKHTDCDVFYFATKRTDLKPAYDADRFQDGIQIVDVSKDVPFMIAKCTPTVFRASTISKYKLRFNDKQIYHEDGCFTTLVVCRTQKICLIKERNANYIYRVHPGTIMTSVNKPDFYGKSNIEILWDLPKRIKSAYGYDKLPQYASYYISRKIHMIFELEKAKRDIKQNFPERDCEMIQNWYRKVADEDFDRLPEISIIVPCHSCEKTLPGILDSLKKQNMKRWECICVSDEDNPKLHSMIRDYASKDKRIKFIDNPNRNHAAISRNMGLDASIGRYVWFLDSDDSLALTESGLQRMLETCDKEDSDICIFPCVQYDGSGRMVKNFLHRASTIPDLIGRWFKNSNITSKNGLNFIRAALYNPWNKVIKREFLLSHPSDLHFQDLAFSNDVLFAINCFRLFQTIAFPKTAPIYNYLAVSGSTSSVQNRRKNLPVLATLLTAILDLDFDNVELKEEIIKEKLDSTRSILERSAKYAGMSEVDISKEVKPFLQPVLMRCKRYIDTGKYGLLKRIIQDGPMVSNSGSSIIYDRQVDFHFEDTTQKHDFVWVLGSGSGANDLELLYSISSAMKFCKDWIGKIYVVGMNPRCSLKQFEWTHIPCIDTFGSKDANIIYKTLFAIDKVKNLSENFLLCSDDQMAIKPCTWADFAPRSIKKFDKDDNAFYSLCHKEFNTNHWLLNLYKTLDRFDGGDYTVYYYQPHIWSPINKTSFKKMCHDISWKNNDANIIFSLYYNYIHYESPIKNENHLFLTKNRIDWPDVIPNLKEKFLAYNDGVFCSTPFRKELEKILRKSV